MYTNMLLPTDGSELAGKAVAHGIALARADGGQNHRAHGPVAFPYVHDRHADDRGHAGPISPRAYKSMPRKSSATPPTQRERRAFHARRPRLKTRASIPGDHRYRGARKAAISSSWLRTAATGFPRSSSAARQLRCSPIARYRCWFTAEPRGALSGIMPQSPCVASLSARISSSREIIPANWRSGPSTGKLRLRSSPSAGGRG